MERFRNSPSQLLFASYLVGAWLLLAGHVNSICRDVIPEAQVTMCPSFPDNTDVSEHCVVLAHDASSGSGTYSCKLTATYFEPCPGRSCRLTWYANRTAEGKLHVLVESTNKHNCSLFPHDAGGGSDCSKLNDTTPCTDTKELRDGREFFNARLRHDCTCIGANCTLEFISHVAVDVLRDDPGSVAIPIAVAVGGVLGMLVGVLFAILLCRHIRRQALYVKANDSPETADLLTFGKPADVQLDQTVARGRYGIVWQGVSEGEHVAVKVTNDRNKDTWRNECQLLSTSFMRHPNIVRFRFGEEKVTSSNVKELWLVMEFCPLGSLFSYLRVHKLAWNECVDLMSSLAIGIDFLHSDNLANKFQIAHRDLKSNNVLVKLSPQPHCVLADFGLAVTLSPGMDPAILQHQAGTPRYMAPECLASCVDFQDCDAFLRADMYSLGLLLWEIAFCCTDFNYEKDVQRHELPYWQHVGDQPSMRSMQDIVINQRIRPSFPVGWEIAKASVKDLYVFTECLKDMWALEPEERVSVAALKHHTSRMHERKVEDEAAIKSALQAAGQSGDRKESLPGFSTPVCSPRSPPSLEKELQTGLEPGEMTNGTVRDDSPDIKTPVFMPDSGVGTREDSCTIPDNVKPLGKGQLAVRVAADSGCYNTT